MGACFICLVEKNQYNYIYSYKGICFIITIINMLIVREISFPVGIGMEQGASLAQAYGQSGRIMMWIYFVREKIWHRIVIATLN